MSEPPSLSPAAAALVSALRAAILQRFPQAAFEVRVAMADRVYLTVYTELDNDFEIQDVAAEQTVNAMLSDDLKIHVMPRSTSHLIEDERA